MNQKSRRELFQEQIDLAIWNSSPYKKDTERHLHFVYCTYLLRELLTYSAIDLMEVRAHLESLAERGPANKR